MKKTKIHYEADLTILIGKPLGKASLCGKIWVEEVTKNKRKVTCKSCLKILAKKRMESWE